MGNFNKFIKATKWNFLVIDKVTPCCKVKELRRMIAGGVDINGCDTEFASTALMLAMSKETIEVVRILLSCNNIKIDARDKFGSTALHYACINNQVENVKLFLEHPACDKEIVRVVDKAGYTAQMMAEKRGNKESARLVREYLEDNDDRVITANVEDNARNVDDLVEFITGERGEKKKKRRKKKNLIQSVSAENIKNSIKTENKDDFANLIKTKEEIEQKIDEKRRDFDATGKEVKDIMYTKVVEINNLDSIIEKSQVEKKIRMNKIGKLDQELSDLEIKMTKLEMKKTKLLEESKDDDKLIKKYENKKQNLENNFEKELKICKEKGNTIKDEIQDLEAKLQETEKLIKALPNEFKLFDEPNNKLLEFIDDQIIAKRNELKCPVCLEVASTPIFMCSDQHLICSTCRPQLYRCPECRADYREKLIRHRYAEKTVEELEKLKDKKDHIRKYSG